MNRRSFLATLLSPVMAPIAKVLGPLLPVAAPVAEPVGFDAFFTATIAAYDKVLSKSFMSYGSFVRAFMDDAPKYEWKGAYRAARLSGKRVEFLAAGHSWRGVSQAPISPWRVGP